jgi:hypothetical protein
MVEKSCSAAQRSDGQLTIDVVDSQSGQPIVARMHLKNARGRPVPFRIPGAAEFGGRFYIDGRAVLPLRVGQYTFELDAGPEYRTQSGHFEIERHADDAKRIEMKRFADLREEGWFGGDLDVNRRLADLPIIMRGEGLSIAPVRATPSRRSAPRSVRPRPNPSSRRDGSGQSIDAPCELVATHGGQLLVFHTASPFEAIGESGTSLSSLQVIRKARERGARVIARVPYAWDMPVWLASGELDAIQLIHHHALYDGVVDNENDGRHRDKKLFPGIRGNGRWSEAVYYHALNCGFRIPPAAGSGSGDNDSPVGTNRVYAYCGEDFSDAHWWEAVLAGRVVVTNGPLLRPKVQGHAPGYVFHVDSGGTLSLEVGLDLATRVPVEYLQIIKNGEVAEEVRLTEWTNKKGQLPPLNFDASGWFLVRAVTNNLRTYQFASSGPYYVEKGGKPRVSRLSVQFFLDWIDAASARIRSKPDLVDESRETLLAEQESARRHFERLLAETNAD